MQAKTSIGVERTQKGASKLSLAPREDPIYVAQRQLEAAEKAVTRFNNPYRREGIARALFGAALVSFLSLVVFHGMTFSAPAAPFWPFGIAEWCEAQTQSSLSWALVAFAAMMICGLIVLRRNLDKWLLVGALQVPTAIGLLIAGYMIPWFPVGVIISAGVFGYDHKSITHGDYGQMQTEFQILFTSMLLFATFAGIVGAVAGTIDELRRTTATRVEGRRDEARRKLDALTPAPPPARREPPRPPVLDNILS